MTSTPIGQVITFHSYKGGAGRSFALANIACVLAQRERENKGVLMIDWDLEAPTLHSYFREHLQYVPTGNDQTLNDHPGVLDLFEELGAKIQTKTNGASKLSDEATLALLQEINLERFILPTQLPGLSLLKAGSFDQRYITRVNAFSWGALYYRAPLLFQGFAEYLATRYQYVLVDSRAGLKGTGGICTMLLPDKLVAVFTPSPQSWSGTFNLIQYTTNYRQQSADLRPFVVFPLASCLEPAAGVLHQSWRTGTAVRNHIGYQVQFEQTFQQVYKLDACHLETYFNHALIPYAPSYAGGEAVATLVDQHSESKLLLSCYENFARLLTTINTPWEVVELAPVADEQQLHTIQEALPPPGTEETPQDEITHPVEVSSEQQTNEQAPLASLSRRQILWFASVTLLASIATLVAIIFWNTAHKQTRVVRRQAAMATAKKLAFQAELARFKNPLLLERSTLLAIESLRRAPSLEADQSLRRSLALLRHSTALFLHEEWISAVAFSSDGKYLATASRDNTTRVWDLSSQQEVLYVSHDEAVFAVAFSPDGKYLATGSRDSSARVWDIATKQEILRIPHEGWVSGVAFSPDGLYLATASRDNSARIWDIPNKQEVLRLQHEGWVSAVTFSPSGLYLATASRDNSARLWDRTTKQEVMRVLHESAIFAIAFSPDGQYLATASRDKTARLWDRTTKQEVMRLTHAEWVLDVAFSADGNYLATASSDNTARIWERKSTRQVAQFAHAGWVSGVMFSPDSRFLATASEDTTARIWEVHSEQERTLLPQAEIASTVAFSPDGKMFAIGSEDNIARIFNVSNKQEVMQISHDEMILSVAFSPDGKHLATASRDGTSRVWAIDTKQEILHVTHDGWVLNVAFSPDGKYLATASRDKTARRWDLTTGKEVSRLAHQDVVLGVAFSPDGKYLATASRDKTARRWDVGTGKETARISLEDTVSAVALSTDGKYLLIGSEDHTAQVWEVNRKQELTQLSHADAVSAVAFSRDGKYLATTSRDKTVSVTVWRAEDMIAVACARLNRNLTQEEWKQYLGDEPYRKTCENLPEGG